MVNDPHYFLLGPCYCHHYRALLDSQRGPHYAEIRIGTGLDLDKEQSIGLE